MGLPTFKAELLVKFVVIEMSVSNSQGAESYTKPRRGALSCLPSSWVPYAELMRIDKPIGGLNIYFPYLFGSLFAACVRHNSITPESVLAANLRLYPMAILLRSAGCTWNDIIDRNLDRQVARTRFRPMARNAVSLKNGLTFYGVQMAIFLVILSSTDLQTISYATTAILLGHIYPFAKRVTNYPQVVLGLSLSWGVLVGCTFQGISPLTLAIRYPSSAVALGCLCLSYCSWTIIHDTIYAFQDIQDDTKAGIKSMSRRHEKHATRLLLSLALLQVTFHIATGIAMRAGVLYYLGACVAPAALLGLMVIRVDVRDPQICWWWFRHGSLIIGWTVALGLIGEYGQRLRSAEEL